MRYCSRCLTSQNTKDGDWKVYDNGLKRKWICAYCLAKNRTEVEDGE